MNPKTCETCKDGYKILGTKDCFECVNFSNWKDVEGMKIKCIKDVVMNSSKRETAYISGKIYEAINEGREGFRAEDEQGDKRHWISQPGDIWFDKYFEIIPTIPAKLINTTDPQFLPSRKYPKDAGADLRARIDHNISLAPQEMVKIPTGVSLEIPSKHVGIVTARSGATAEGKVALVGIIDSDYRGEIGLNVVNMARKWVEICHGERLAQIVILPCSVAEFEQVEELGESERGSNGFGSSGKF